MSHFLVLVIGNNIEQQLAPYHEFECTGTDDEYVQDIDETDEARRQYEEYGQESQTFAEYIEGDGKKLVRYLEKPDLTGPHKYGYALLDANGEVTKVIDRTNPNAHWDWWVCGGRWSGWLKLKSGAQGELGDTGVMGTHWDRGEGRADQARLGDIDFAGMSAEAAKEASERWEKARRAHRGAPWKTWEEARKDALSIDAARLAYFEQAPVQAMKQAFKDEFGTDFDSFQQPHDVYTKRAADRAIVPFALVKDGKWHARGKMGWWACVSDEKDEDAWVAEASRALTDLPPDTLITVIDCHI